MGKKNCFICNKIFETINKTKKCCSEECRKIWKQAYNKNYRDTHKEKIKELKKQYKKEHGEEIKSYMKEYLKDYAKNNKEKIRAIMKKFKKTDKGRESRRRYQNRRYRRDIKFKIKTNMSNMLRARICKYKKSTFEILDYDLDTLIKHLKNTIPNGYIWSDYIKGSLQIDHIIPVSLYSFKDYSNKEFKKCWNLLNLRLISKKDNHKKSNKLDVNLIEEHNIKHLLPESGTKE
tara:strand:- start:3316 stop:4014 length:699 start_codon:yes stop_codon:yes gene_type:complete